MIQSMTGFGKADVKSKKIQITVQIKSVNGRFLDLRIKHPSEYLEFDQEFRKIIGQKFSRGSVDVFIHRKYSDDNLSGQLNISEDRIKVWRDNCQKIKKKLKLNQEEYLTLFRRVPDLVTPEEQETVKDEKNLVLQCLQEAVDNCVSDRKKEGESLGRELKSQIEGLATIRQKILGLKETIAVCLKENFEKRIAQINTSKIEIDPNRLSQEVLILADKADVTEELVRLDSHINAFKEAIKSTEVIGKKMDFMSQELLREVNTIGSKVQNTEIVSLVIEAKSCIEKIREQVQNIQ